MDPATLDQARELLGPHLQAYPGTILLGHYLAVRGLNNMSNVNCLATLGDPWPHLNRVRHEVMFLGLEDTWQSRMVDLCKAELEQAHGRLRAVHRQALARAIHVGGVRPTGHGWTAGPVEETNVAVGRPRNAGSVETEEIKRIVGSLGGVRAAAKRLGCHHTSVTRYMRGRPPPPSIAEALRAVALPS